MVNLVYTNVKGDTFGITLIPDKPFNVLSGDILQLDVSPDNVFQNGADLFIMVDGAIYILRNFFENSSVTEGPQTSIWYDGSQYFATDFQTTIQPEFVRYEIADFAGLPFSNFANNTPLPSFQTVNFFNDQTPDLINSIIAVDIGLFVHLITTQDYDRHYHYDNDFADDDASTTGATTTLL